MRKRPFAFLIVLALAALCHAQVNISGSVFGSDGEPLEGANVTSADPPLAASTDANGLFTLTTAVAGDLHLHISHVSHITLDTTVAVEIGANTFSFRLRPVSILLKEAEVNAVRAGDRAPIAKSLLTHDEIARTNVGVDLPYLLDQQPSVVTTSDGGTGVGYTGLRIRGSDPTRINATINGVPLNGAEDQAVYWVDMPDFASSVEDVQVQRGVGTSTNGPGAFGASINLRTALLRRHPFAQVDLSGGSFNTQRVSAQAGTGLLGEHFAFDARLSTIQSDGYIDRATADLKSYFVQGAWVGGKSSLRFITFGGHEVTYQAWGGVPKEVIDTNRTYNPYTYDNEVDDYTQTHYQLLFDQRLGKSSALNVTLFRVDGSGFYENYEANVMAWDDPYLPFPIILEDDTIRRNDYIIRRWLDNTLLGVNVSVKTTFGKHELVVGGSYSEYQCEHFGEVIWAKFFGQYDIRHRYYDNDADKSDVNAFAKLTFAVNDRIDLYGDLQWRGMDYHFLGYDADLENLTQTVTYGFFNPKAGIVARVNEGGRAYASIAVANKEPNRDDFTDSSPTSRPKPERLIDYEAGCELKTDALVAGINLYYMDYTNQLVLTGQLNDVGAYTRVNVKSSYRAGIEVTASARIAERLTWKINATFSRNRIRDLTEYVDDWDNGGQVTAMYDDVDLAFSPSVIAGSELSLRFMERVRSKADIALVTKYIGEQFLDNSGSSARSLDPYLVNDLRLNWSITGLKGLKELAFNVTARNVFSELYESNGWSYSYIAEGRRQELVGLFPQAPLNVLAGLSVRF